MNSAIFHNFLVIAEFNFVLASLLLSFLLSLVIFFLSFFLVYQSVDFEKSSAYECGFNPFEDSRNKFEIKFYLVSILFIIFDLEIVFLFPWVVSFVFLDLFVFILIFSFVFVLFLGFFFEWKKKALDWN